MKDTKFTDKIHNFGIAIDLGTTTIAVSCLDLETKEELTSFSYANPQTAYGADVITRIKKCIDEPEMVGKLGGLVKDSIAEQLMKHSPEFFAGDEDEMFKYIKKIVISGNTTMAHILRGLSVKGLASAPFESVTLDYNEESLSAFYSYSSYSFDADAVISYPPGFSAFVGADILTGVEFLDMGKNESFDLLVDLGTNGEMVLINKDIGYATSTACGPVFDNAVSGAKYGSECIKAIAGCLKTGLINYDGVIKEPYFEKGIMIDKGFVIKQDHVRSFQLAKGAIYAGIMCLIEKAEIGFSDIGNVYISGGLGFYMDIRDAFTVKMLPKELKNKLSVSGNTSLNGAEKLIISDDGKADKILAEYENIRSRTESFELSTYPNFNEYFLKAMDF